MIPIGTILHPCAASLNFCLAPTVILTKQACGKARHQKQSKRPKNTNPTTRRHFWYRAAKDFILSKD